MELPEELKSALSAWLENMNDAEGSRAAAQLKRALRLNM
jgi:hypothetical protein